MYRKSLPSWLKHLDFIILDIICMEAAYVFAFMIRFGIANPWNAITYRSLIFVIPIMQLLLAALTGSYSGIVRRSALREFAYVIRDALIYSACAIVFFYLNHTSGYMSRQVFVWMTALDMAFMYVARVSWKRRVLTRFRSSKNRAHLLVVTEKQYLEEMIPFFSEIYYGDYNVVGFAVMDEKWTGRELARNKQDDVLQVVTDEEGLYTYILTHAIDEVYVNLDGSHYTVKEIVGKLGEIGVTVHISLEHNFGPMPRKEVGRMNGLTVLTTSMQFAAEWELALKRIMDICGSLVGLFFTAIIFVICAPIIKKQSPGPVFFSQVRVGKNGRKFKMYKFRSMYTDAEERKKELMAQNEMNGLMFKMKDDPRIFPFGKFMRKTSLDEFPQFLNILKGDMSLVGTRPPTVDEYNQYELHHKARLAAKPGLTGMWQVSGRSDIKDFEEIVRLDTQYITHWSLGLDVRILFQTVGAVLNHKGSV